MPEVTIGMKVRSYDFASADYYVDGEVTAIGREHYTIRCERRVYDGKDVSEAFAGVHYYPPINGMPTTLGRITDGVCPLSHPLVGILMRDGAQVFYVNTDSGPVESTDLRKLFAILEA